jgi:outer membrane protein assembly factor BamB
VKIENRIIPVVGLCMFVLSAASGFAQPADSPWPVFHGNMKHTGQSRYNGPLNDAAEWAYRGASGAPVIGTDGTIYISAVPENDPWPMNDIVLAINPDGTLKWKCDEKLGSLRPVPAIGQNGTIYYSAFYFTNAYSQGNVGLTAIGSDGHLKWKWDSGNFSDYGSDAGAPAIGLQGEIYISSMGSLYRIVDNGTSASAEKFASNAGVFPTITDSGVVITGGYGMINSSNGKNCATGGFGNADVVTAPLIGSDGTVYFRDTGYEVYACVEGEVNFTEKWRSRLPSKGRASPALGNNGTLYIGADDGYLYALHSANGASKWKYFTGIAGNVRGSAVIGADGIIYFANHSYVYAVRDEGPQASLVWKSYISDWGINWLAIAANGSLYVAGYLSVPESATITGWLYSFGQTTNKRIFLPLIWKPLNAL